MTNENQIIIYFYNQIKNKMKKIIPKSNIKIAKRRKIDTLTHKNMTAHYPDGND